MQFITFFPLLFSLYQAVARSPQAAFLNVYLPVLLLFPDYFFYRGPVFHHFAETALFGVALFLRPRWKFTFPDLLIGCFFAASLITEFRTTIFTDVLSLCVDRTFYMLLPYLCGKYLIEQNGVRSATARRFVLLVLAVALVSPFEFVSGQNPFFRFFYRFFEQWPLWQVQHRWGFSRVAGPYGHAILAGCIFLCAVLLQLWLYLCGKCERVCKWLPIPGVHAGLVVLAGVAAGSFMSLSRGPWIGLLFGVCLFAVGLARKRVRAGIVFAVLAVAGGLYGYNRGVEYTDVTWQTVSDEDQQNAFYRRELLTVYNHLAEDGGFWGWGKAHRPNVKGMESVDNEYLFVTLEGGKAGLYLFSAILLCSVLRLLAYAFSPEPCTREDRLFRFLLASIVSALAISISTVYLGLQVMPVLYLFIGWGEGLLITRRAGQPYDAPVSESAPASQPVFAYAHILQ